MTENTTDGNIFALTAYNKRLTDNLTTLNDDDTIQCYPALYKALTLRGCIYKRLLEAIMTDCLNSKYKEYKPNSGGAYQVSMSMRYLANTHSELATTPSTWSSAIVVLACIGLLKTGHPTVNTASTPEEKKAVENAESNDQPHAISFIRFDKYTPQQMEYMDEAAQKWLDYNHKAGLRKADVITIYGKKKANAIFGDTRPISKNRQGIIDKMKSVLEDLLQVHQYTTQSEFLKAYRPDNQESAMYDWRSNSKIIFSECKLKYRQQSKIDKDRYKIPENERGWIITTGK